MQTTTNWHCLATADQVALVVYQRILDAAEAAIKKSGKFKLVLAGGGTPEKIYRLLADADADWARWFIYYGDERCLPVDHKDRNSLMAAEAFLNKVAIPAEQIFPIPAESGPVAGAAAYATTVDAALPFDLVLLGMGEDGHTASLFPGHQHPEVGSAHPVFNSPKPPPERVTISAPALTDTHELIFIVTGSNKQEAVKAWRTGSDLPVAAIAARKSVDIYIDKDAYDYQ